MSAPGSRVKPGVLVVVVVAAIMFLVQPSIPALTSAAESGVITRPPSLSSDLAPTSSDDVLEPVSEPTQQALATMLQQQDPTPVTTLPVETSMPTIATAVATTASLDLALTQGWNPASCKQQPNLTAIDPYKGCPIPGLNNLLYTQHNRWYCLYRDNQQMWLRDRTCNKGSGEKYRYSTILQVRYDRLALFQRWAAARRDAGMTQAIVFGNSRHGGAPALLPDSRPASSDTGTVAEAFAAFERHMKDTVPLDNSIVPAQHSRPSICWADIMEKVLPKKCDWNEIPSFYGKPQWWEARHFIDFHSEYYVAARQILNERLGEGTPFLALHLRRGDYIHHCRVIKKKRLPAWVTFWPTKSLMSKDGTAFSSCYPSVEEVEQVIDKLTAETGLKHVFIATNEPSEFANITTAIENLRTSKDDEVSSAGRKPWRAFVLPPLESLNPKPLVNMRFLDTLILDMIVLSLGSHFVFNRYSSFSATVYEAAAIHGRITTSNVNCW